MGQKAFDAYVEPARASAGFFRTIAGVVLIIVGWLLSTTIVMGGFVVSQIMAGMEVPEALASIETDLESGTPASIVRMLATFVGIWPAAWAVLRILHGRPFGTLFAPEGRIRWDEFGIGLLLALGLFVASTLVGTLLVGMPERSALSLADWAMWLVPLAVVVFIQASGEELIFRGYLFQQLTARWRSPVLAGVLTSILFGLAHFTPGNSAIMNVVYVAATLVFGLIAALLVWRTGSLAAAMGIHVGNNFGALTLTGLDGGPVGSQLFVHAAGAKETLILIDLGAMTLLLVLLVSAACPRRLRGDDGDGRGRGRIAAAPWARDPSAGTVGRP